MRWPDSLRYWNRWSVLLLVLAVGFLLLSHASGMGPLGALEGWLYGRSSASDCIEEGQPHLLYLGLSGAYRRGVLDTETGLPEYSVGCVATHFAESQVSAHNSRVLDALEDGRLEGRTFSSKVRRLSDIEGEFSKGSSRQLKGPVSFGRYTVEREGGQLYLSEGPDGLRRGIRDLFLRSDPVDVLTVDEGETLYLRCQVSFGGTPGFVEYHSVDMPHRLHLQGWRRTVISRSSDRR